jgi:signal peptidase I
MDPETAPPVHGAPIDGVALPAVPEGTRLTAEERQRWLVVAEVMSADPPGLTHDDDLRGHILGALMPWLAERMQVVHAAFEESVAAIDDRPASMISLAVATLGLERVVVRFAREQRALDVTPGSEAAASLERAILFALLPLTSAAADGFARCAERGATPEAWRAFCAARARGLEEIWGPDIPNALSGTPEWGCAILGACGGFLSFRPFATEGPAMEPGLRHGSRFLLGEGDSPPIGPGQIAVFRSPSDGTSIVKRIIAVGPASVTVDDGGVVVNGARISTTIDCTAATIPEARPGDQDPVPTDYACQREAIGEHTWITTRRARSAPIQGAYEVPPGRLFVLGDHRDRSNDSRILGAVPPDALLGPAFPIPTIEAWRSRRSTDAGRRRGLGGSGGGRGPPNEGGPLRGRCALRGGAPRRAGRCAHA